MRRNNKKWVRNIMIVSVLGLAVLMVTLFATLQAFFNRRVAVTYIEQEIASMPVTEVALSESRMVVVSLINNRQVVGYDIKEGGLVTQSISDVVQVNDAYGKVFPLSEIKKGDLIEVSYQKEKGEITAINKSIQVQSYKKISGITVNTTTRQINIGGMHYSYEDEMLIMDAEGNELRIEQVGPFDIVSLQELNGVVWSITVEEQAASVQIVDLPTQNGQIEIGNSRLIRLKDITEPIRLIPGTHKIVIKMDGYVTITDSLTVGSGEVLELSLIDAEIAYTTILPNISPKSAEYVLQIGDETYNGSEEIRLPQGSYPVVISADGYEVWRRTIVLDKEVYYLSAGLTLIEEDETNDGTTNEIIEETRTIVLNTDPVGAKVYINGGYRGDTPYTVSLADGTYDILFEKSGYMVYSANIVLDSSSDQSSFLYVLNLIE